MLPWVSLTIAGVYTVPKTAAIGRDARCLGESPDRGVRV